MGYGKFRVGRGEQGGEQDIPVPSTQSLCNKASIDEQYLNIIEISYIY